MVEVTLWLKHKLVLVAEKLRFGPSFGQITLYLQGTARSLTKAFCY